MITNDIMTWIMLSLVTITAITIICYSMLTAWREWLAHKKMLAQFDMDDGDLVIAPNYGLMRIELADLRHRISKLEKKRKIFNFLMGIRHIYSNFNKLL